MYSCKSESKKKDKSKIHDTQTDLHNNFPGTGLQVIQLIISAEKKLMDK